MSNWLTANGALLFAIITAIASVLTANAAALHLPPVAMAWISTCAAIATAVHAAVVSPESQSAAKGLLKSKGVKP